MKKTRTERKIERLADDLYRMAKNKALEFVDVPAADAAASKMVQSFADIYIQVRAVEWTTLHGEPKNDKERKKASEYIIGKKYRKFLAENSQEVKDDFRVYINSVKVRLSEMTMMEVNVNEN